MHHECGLVKLPEIPCSSSTAVRDAQLLTLYHTSHCYISYPSGPGCSVWSVP